jgi:pimeloyl-ACP methyl ester carboxylesterase
VTLEIRPADRAVAAPLVAALHCSASSPRQWRAYAERVGARARVVAPALVGYADGDTPWPVGAAIGLHDEAWNAWRQLPPGPQPVHLVGHSYGATVALVMARLAPQRVRSLTLFEPIPFALLRDAGHRHEWHEIRAVAARVRTLLCRGRPVGADRARARGLSAPGRSQARIPEHAARRGIRCASLVSGM